MHESVDGADAEAAVVVDDLLEKQLSIGFQRCSVDAELLDQAGFHAFWLILQIAVDDVVEVLKDLGLHLVGRLVGEGDGENLVEVGGVGRAFQAQAEILLDDGVGLA